jgi:CRP-like cAMP-binding protein
MEALFNQIKQYCKLSAESQQSLSSAMQKVELTKGSLLTQESKTCQHMYFLEKGCVRAFYNFDGKEITYWFAFENSFVTSFFSFITQQPGMENIQLLEDSTLWSVSHSNLQQLYSKHPEMERVGRILLERYYVMLEERFVRNHFKEARERYENLLTTNPDWLQRVPLGYIASYLGITQETLSRIRGKA